MVWLFVHLVMIFSVLSCSHYILGAQHIVDGSTNVADVLAKGQQWKPVLIDNGSTNVADVPAKRQSRKLVLVDAGSTYVADVIANEQPVLLKEFRDVMKKTLNVSDALLELPDIEKWFDKEFTSKRKKFNPGDPVQKSTAVVQSASMLCALCQEIQNCPCILKHCFNVPCLAVWMVEKWDIIYVDLWIHLYYVVARAIQ